MGSKISCYTCEHYRPTGDPKIRLCNLLEDLAGDSFYVNRSSNECLYNFNTPPKVLTKSETKLRDEEAETKRRAFWEHAKKVKDEVDSWSEEERRRNYGQ